MPHLSRAQIIVLRGHVRLGREELEVARDLRLIIKAGSGLDNIDIEAVHERNIKIKSLSASAPAVAEHAVTLLLASWRNVRQMDLQLRHGNWMIKYNSVGRLIRGAALGIVGFGRIGRETARLAAALGFSILVYDRSPDRPEKREFANRIGARCLSLDDLLRSSQAISLHVPLTTETYRLLGARELDLLPKGAIVVNTSRAKVIDEIALIERLGSGQLGGAGVDVFSSEPVSPDDPILGCENVICTPHIGAQTLETMRSMARMIAESIDEYRQEEGV